MKIKLLKIQALMWLLATAFCFSEANAQQFKLHAEYRSDWYGAGYDMLTYLPGYVGVTVQAEVAAEQFVIESDNSFNKWRKNGTNLLTVINEPGFYEFFANLNVTDNFLTENATVGHYYTTNLKNVGYQSTTAVVLKTTNAPVNFAASNAVTQLPAANAVAANQNVQVSVTMAGERSPEEKVFLRYTTDNWTTSTLIPVNFGASLTTLTGTAEIPQQPAGTVVNYYVLSSSADLASTFYDYDLMTLKFNNNGGSNYTYTVQGAAVLQVPITFRVNMSNETVSTQGVFLAGSFNGFSATANPMTLIGNGVYEAVVNLDTQSVVQYKFVNGTSFETVPGICGVNDGGGIINRNLVVPSGASVLPTVCFAACTNCPQPTTVNVTFRVNMSLQTVSPNGVHLAGSFNGFSPTATPMASVGNNVYEVTIPLDTTATVQYKFVNGITFLTEETVPAACGVLNAFSQYDRNLVVPETNTVLPTVCFGACVNCPLPPANVDVTFRVNMSEVTVSGEGVFLAGTFNGFSATANPMTLVGNGVYEATVSLDTTTTVQYKFVNGNDYEIVPNTCGVNDGNNIFNRNLAVPQINTVLPTVCFAACINCIPPVVSNVTFRVNMSLQTVSANGVHIVGSFNNFNPSANPMQSIGNGVYQAVVPINAGQNITYKFLNGNSFSDEEQVPEACGVFNGFGGYDRSLTVSSEDTVLNTVCFGACVNCPAAPANVNVTFRVNMSLQTVSANGVHVSGSFNGWSPTANPMTLVGNGVYEAVVSVPENTVYQYKFLNGNTFANEEQVPSACGVANTVGGFDREVNVTNADTVLTTVCFASCSNCVVPSNVNVTFRVNMSLQTVSANGVHVSGSFNGWSPTANPMTLVGNGVYEAVVSVPENTVYQYKFLNGNTFANEEQVPSACGVANTVGGFDREVNVTNADTVLTTVCFASCSNCVVPSNVNVTFRVNMSLQTVSANGVNLAGSFNGFSPTATPMLSIGNGIYETSVAIAEGTEIQYKFINGNSFANEETVPSSCGVANGVGSFDRTLTTSSNDTILPIVCFSECENCVITNLSVVKDEINFSIYPNPTNGNVFLTSNAHSDFVIEIFNATGQKVLVFNSSGNQGLIELNTSELESGVYFIRLNSGFNSVNQKLIKQ